MKILTGSVLLTVLISCVQHPDNGVETFFHEEEIRLEVKHAKGFELIYAEDYLTVLTHSINDNEVFRDSIIIPYTKSAPVEGKWMNDSLNSLTTMSSTHLAFLKVLDQLQLVRGLCGMNYVAEIDVREILEQNEVREICLGENLQQETILGISPDLHLAYPFGHTSADDLSDKGIQSLLIAEYLETEPLARLEWIKLFGVLTRRSEAADQYFTSAEKDYTALCELVEQKTDRFILNLPFKDSWFMPSSKSLTVRLIEDSGLRYYYEEETGTENILHPTEQVWNDAGEAEWWIIMANRPVGFGLDDLLKEEAVYATFKAVRDGHVIFCNTAETPYFSKGVTEPHIMLRDLLYALGVIDDHNPVYFKLIN